MIVGGGSTFTRNQRVRIHPEPTDADRARGARVPAFRAMSAGCGGLTPGDNRSCNGEVTATGLWFYSHRRSAVWQGFACEQHAQLLIAPRRLLPRDYDVLRRRQRRAPGQHTEAHYAGEQDGPLARGRDAEQLVARAQAWAARNPLAPLPRDLTSAGSLQVWCRGRRL